MSRIQKIFQLSEKGAKGVAKSIISSFALYCTYILPSIVVLVFVIDVINESFHSVSFYVISVLVVFIIMFIVLSINYKIVYSETYKESENLRTEIADIMKELPLSYYSKRDLSDLGQTILKDVSDIEHAMSHAIPKVISFSFFFLLLSIPILKGNLILGLANLIPILLSFILIFMTKKIQTKNTENYYLRLRQTSQEFQEAIEMQKEIKAFALTDNIQKSLIQAVEDGEKIHLKTELVQSIPHVFSASLIKFAFALTIVFGAILYSNNQISLFYFLVYLLASVKVSDGISSLHFNISELFYINARIERIKELRENKIQHGKKEELTNFDIEFNNVSFSYEDNSDEQIIKGISFIAKQNQVTSIVGASGSGKTTILKLISRLYDVDSGKIEIDKKDINKIATDSLFKYISVVFQDVTLFNTSILENIRIGNQNATDDEVKKAATLANCDSFIQKLPNKYDTIIGENGSSLSGGERQRLSIARAFLKNAPIILLDEISSSLDVENEIKIQESLNSLIKNKTVVIISHRIKSIQNTDKIVVLNKGAIEAIGKHSELIESSNTYNMLIKKSGFAEEFKF